MGPCPLPQHQPLGGVYTYIILSIYIVYTNLKDIHGISQKYTIYIPSIYNVYTEHILCINVVYTKDIPYSIYHEYKRGIYKGYTI
jgi:hypothetical protein